MATKTNEDIDIRPEYYEVNGMDITSRNRWWVVTALSLSSTIISVIFAIMVRMKPDTVIWINPHGEPTVIGRDAPPKLLATVQPGNDDFLNQAFIRRFLTTYLNYTPTDVDAHWAASLNMMTQNIRSSTKAALIQANARGNVDDDQIQSVFHLKELDKVPDEYLTYIAYGAKDVHHLVKGTETVDHIVSEYRFELIAERRSETNPDGLLISHYSEREIDGERKEQILATPDADVLHQ